MVQILPPGRPLSLTPEVKKRILDAVPLAFAKVTIAHYSMIHPNNLKRWLKMGCDDMEAGVSSEYSQFWCEFNQARAKKVTQWLKDVEQRLPNWQATWELVKSVAKEDFGIEAVEYKELLEKVDQLSNALKRYTENPPLPQGAISNGSELDSKSHVEK
jgi:hypothetical protein